MVRIRINEIVVISLLLWWHQPKTELVHESEICEVKERWQQIDVFLKRWTGVHPNGNNITLFYILQRLVDIYVYLIYNNRNDNGIVSAALYNTTFVGFFLTKHICEVLILHGSWSVKTWNTTVYVRICPWNILSYVHIHIRIYIYKYFSYLSTFQMFRLHSYTTIFVEGSSCCTGSC